MRALAPGTWLIAALVCGGCESAPPPPVATNHVEPREVTLGPADEKELATAVARYRGNVVLVDCWATWCQPCVEQFPHTVALARERGPLGLRVISLCFNEPDEREAALQFLRKQGATFDNLLSRYGGAQQGFAAFGIRNGALPYYLLYDRTGKPREALGSGGADHPLKPAELDRAIEKLLAEPVPR